VNSLNPWPEQDPAAPDPAPVSARETGAPHVYQEGSPSALDARGGRYTTDSGPYSHPGLERVGTKLSYCNGEIDAGSSNITLYIVWPYAWPPCIAQALPQWCMLPVEG